MYKPTKRVVAAFLTAGILLSVSGISANVEAGQDYDSSNVGISIKVGEYLEEKKSEDPVSDLTDGIVTMADVYAETEVTTASDADATATDATSTDASPTDAHLYPQFQDRAVATAEGKVNIRTEASPDAEVVGVLDRGGICLVDEIGEEWTKIESGTCVGYIANEYLAYGDDAGTWCENNGIARTAVINTATLKVREEKDESSECVTLVPEGEEYYVYSVGDEWTELSVDDDVRGFVKSEYVDVTFDNPRAVSVEEQAEADRKAKEEADAAWLAYLASLNTQTTTTTTQQNTNTNQTTTTTTTTTTTQQTDNTQTVDNTQQTQQTQQTEVATEATTQATTAAPVAAPAGSTGVDLANYACQFVGYSYVYGGSSLTGGTDCSGFTMSVYAAYGYSLPHNAAAQSGYGTEVSLSDLQAGDLLFYSNGGGIGHVAIYIGGGSVVHASNSRDGIKISSYNYRTPVKAVRIINN